MRLVADAFPLNGNRLIEASAGTGKTYTITNLYLRLLLGRGIERPLAVDEILVLTFTVAATEELRGRIRRRILEARQYFDDAAGNDEFLRGLKSTSVDTGEDARLLTAALQLLDEASIFTIHAFCARVLTDNAFETGSLFEQDLDADRDQLLQLAAEDCFRSDVLGLPPMSRAIALDLWRSPDDLIEKVKPYLFRHNLTLVPPPADIDAELATLHDDIRRAKRLWVEDRLSDIIGAAGFNRGRNSIRRLGDMDAWCRTEELQTDLWQYWIRSKLESDLTKAGRMPEHEVLTLIDSIHERLERLGALARYNLWHRITARIRSNLDAYKERFGQLTLDDLLSKVLDALEQPRTGSMLSDELARRWPVAMIDEFQDTDDVQYGIFSRIYRHSSTAAHGLIFVGDPKQAIYQFRGADVYTYINAKRQLDTRADVFSLDTNWRSTPSLLAAVNTLFDQPGVFDNDSGIPFEPVEPSSGADDRHFAVDDHDVVPVSLFQVIGDAPPLNKDAARRLAMAHAAEETRRLLETARRGDALIDGEPLKAGQIAFLVRDRNDARAAREALAARQIRSVYVTLESVFLTETADDLKLILRAVAEPTNERAIRAALATRLMQTPASGIAAFGDDVVEQQRVLQEFMDYHRLWSDLGIAPMLEALVVRREIAGKWLARQDGERQITNLRHLAELLQRRSAVAPGMHRLLKWFTREKRAADTVAVEERQLRLESDSDLVQIVTMHAAKGLEYDVVMIPMAAFVPQQRANEPCLLHEERGDRYETILDFSDEPAQRRAATDEKLAEDMRLLYVAITRARFKCYIGVPNTRELQRAAVYRLLQLTDDDPDAVDRQLRSMSPDLFDVDIVRDAASTPLVQVHDTDSLTAPPSPPRVTDNWRLHSYTGLSRLIHFPDANPAKAFDVTPGFADEPEEAGSIAPTPRLNRFTFPRGPRAGVALHSLLEDLAFEEPVEEQMDAVERCLDRVGLTRNRPEWRSALSRWAIDIVSTPLPAGFRLRELDSRKRLDELEFHFPLDAGSALLDLLKQSGYLDTTATLAAGRLRGIMTGLVDLVFEHDDKFYLVDYKSNHLGENHADYAPDRLTAAVRHHQYELQYLIYCVALVRYLRTRLPHFIYEEHFGGVYYLFLRGMDGKTSEFGVYSDLPDPGLLDRLDAILGGAR